MAKIKNKGMFNPKFKQKSAAQQASNKEFFKNNPGAYITNGRRVVPKPGDLAPRFSQIRKTLQSQVKPATPPSPMQPPGKPLGQAQPLQANPALAAAAQLNQSPMSPPPGKELGQAIPSSPAAPVPPAAASPIAPAAPAPTTVGPAQQMQAQKDQMFPPAPATPVAPAPMAPPAPIVPKPSQITPPAGVTKSQADIDEEKKKLQAAAGSPV